MVVINEETQKTDNEGGLQKDESKEPNKDQETKVVTPMDQLKYLMSTATILIKNSNFVVEKLNKIDKDLDHLYNKVGHTRPTENKKETN